MSQFDRYDNPEIEKECDWEVFVDKENPNIVNVRFGRFKEITIPPKYQWEEGQYIRFLDIDSEKIQECDFSVNGVLEATIHYVRDGLVEIPNEIFSHHGNAQCFVKHVGEDNITVVKAISFLVNRREKPPEYVAPDDEQTFRQWVQEQLDKGLIADITEIPSEEDDGLNIINITMRDGYMYVFTIKNGSKGDPGPGLAEGGSVGQIIIKKSEEDYDTEWVDNPVPSYTVEDAGKILKVANDGESVGWANAPEELPAIEAGDAGKVLVVNETETGAEWAETSLNSLRIIYNETTYDEIYNALHNLHDKLKFVTIQFNDLTTSCHTYPVTEIYVYESYGIPIYVSYWDYGAKYEISILKEEGSTIYSAMQRGRTLITPDIEQGVGKILSWTGYDTAWIDVPKELPNVDVSDDGKILQVVNGSWDKVVQNENGNKTWFGSGVPSSSIASERGDIYIDTANNNKEYICTQYIDPGNVTELTNLDVVLNSTGDYPESGIVDCSFGSVGGIETKSQGIRTVSIEVDGNKIIAKFQQYSGYYNDTLIDGSGETKTGLTIGSNVAKRPIHITFNENARNITNSELIKWFVDNANTISGTGSIWVEASANPLGIPSANGQTNGKILKVNNNAWVVSNETQELPSVTASDEGKILQVDDNGTWVANQIGASGMVTILGSGAPNSNVVAKVGDIYRDTTNNKIYQCYNYIDPSATTDLKGLQIVWNDTINFTGMPAFNSQNMLIFVSNGNSYKAIGHSGSGANQFGYAFPWVYPYKNNAWVDTRYQTINITGGTHTTDSSIINWVLSNSKNAGSSWVELVAKDNRLPDVEVVDAGKILQVSDQGEWEVNSIDINGVVAYYGTTDPTSSLVANTGDIYINRTTNKVFVCKQYNSLDNITDLTGLTLHFKDAGQVYFKYLGTEGVNGTTNITFVCDNVNYTGIYKGLGMNTAYYRDSNSTNVAAYNFSGLPQWYDEKFRTISITGGTDATNSHTIEILIGSADSVSGLGSIWIEVNPDELPSVTGSDVGKVLQVNNLGSWVAGPVPFEGATSYRGSGAPVSSIPANVGDLYMDTTNNKLYECTAYVDPTLTTKLDGLKITLKTTGNFPANGMTDYQFDKGGVTAFGYTNNNTNNQLRELTVTGNKIQVVAWNFGSTRYTLIDGSGSQKENLPIYTGGMIGNPARIAFNNDINLDNQELVNWFIENASDIEGLGSQWVEVVAKDTRLPSVSSTDNGNILKVSSGAWSVQSETKELPAVSSTDNGKLLGVSNGAWAKVSAPTELPSVTSSDEGKMPVVNSSGQWATTNAFEEETWTFTLSDNTQITRTVLIKVVE